MQTAKYPADRNAYRSLLVPTTRQAQLRATGCRRAPGEMRGHPTLVGTSGRAKDEGDARRLWDASERETGVQYAWPS